MKVAVHWFRCDLRLSDNTALHAAVTASDVVVPVFIFDPRILNAADVSPAQVAFMIECLRSLEKNIGAAGGKLILRHGRVLDEMRAVLCETEAKALYYNRDYEPYARERDAAVEKLARSLGLEVHSYKDGVIHEPNEVLKADGRPYRCFHALQPCLARARPSPRVAGGQIFATRRVKAPTSLPLPSAREFGFTAGDHLAAAG